MHWKMELSKATAASKQEVDVNEFHIEPEMALDMMLAADYLDL